MSLNFKFYISVTFICCKKLYHNFLEISMAMTAKTTILVNSPVSLSSSWNVLPAKPIFIFLWQGVRYALQSVRSETH